MLPPNPMLWAATSGLPTLDDWQAETLGQRHDRVLLNCARQTGKSTISAGCAGDEAEEYPGSLTLLISPSLRQSMELYRKVGPLLHSPLIEDNKLSCELLNHSRIVALPGTEHTTRGFSSVDLIILDEASRIPDYVYKALRPMLAVSHGRLIAVSTPFGKRGFFYNEWSSGGKNWQRIEVPATACPRISPEFLVEEQRSLGDLWFRQEYMCKFVDAVSSVFATSLVEDAFKDMNIQTLFPNEAMQVDSWEFVDERITSL